MDYNRLKNQSKPQQQVAQNNGLENNNSTSSSNGMSLDEQMNRL